MEIIKNIFMYGCADTFITYNPDLPEAAHIAVRLICLLLSMVFAYLIGSINFAIILSKLRGDDIRNHGSQNAGTTNMLRTYGKKAAIITLVGDFLKGTVSVLIGMLLMGIIGQYLAALFAVLGHVFPIYYKFKGGKGIATAAGTILACEPIVLLILLIIFALVVAVSKYVSLASVMVAMLYPVILDRYYKLMGAPSGLHVLFVIIMAVIVVWKHWPNIQRLMNKTESKISFKKKPEVETSDNTSDEEQGDNK